MKTITITKSLGLVSQDVRYDEIVRLPSGTKLRIAICSNPYDFQSYATIDRWNGTQWQRVHSILPAAMSTPHALYVRKDQHKDETFAKDRAELLRVAKAVLS